MRKPRTRTGPIGRSFWERAIPQARQGRTSVTLTVLRNPTLADARFFLHSGQGTATIPMDELRRDLAGMNAGKNRQITFTFDPDARPVKGRPTLMWFEP
jgi:hypothetical protein